MTPDTRAEKLIAARAKRRKITFLAQDRPQTWADARLTADLACLGDATAWKLGGTTQFVRDIFDIDYPFYGPLGSHEVYDNGQEAIIPPLPGPVAEPEIAVRLSRDIPPAQTPRTDADLTDMIDAIAPALDIAAVALKDPASEGVLSLIADRAGAGLILTGEWQHKSILPRLKNQPVRLLLGGREVSRGNANVLIGGVLGALRDMLIQAAREDRTFFAGDIIATGGLAPAIPIGHATSVTASFDGWQRAHFKLAYI